VTIRDLTEEILTTQTLKDIAQSYTEISSIRLRKIRKQTEGSRRFFQDLSNIFALLRYFAKIKSARGGPKNQTSGNGKTVVILITSNFRFYGKVSNDASKLFMKYTQDHPSQQIVIGKLGIDFLKSQHYSLSYSALTFKTDMPSHTEMMELVKLIQNYGRVLVVSSEFKTILNQKATIKDLTQTQKEASATDQLKRKDYTFILEPEIHKMIEFFDSQIKNVLLSATFLETELARVASRLITMDQAQTNAKDILKKQSQQLIFAKRALFNKKTLETWAALRSQHGR